MQTISQVTETLLSGKNASQRQETETLPALPTPKPNPLLLGETPLRDSVEAQNQLTRLLEQTYACQKTYADKAEMMEYRDGMFQLILAEYALFEVQKAFLEHVKQSPDLPTPSDIVKIIEKDRQFRLLKKPDIPKLLQYEKKGIRLTPEQQEQLNVYRQCE